MKYFSTFSGIGGFELGIQQAEARAVNERITNGTDERPLCIGFSELDKYAIQIYQNHFNHKNYGDITKIDAKELPDFDLLVGGFPCQSFSIAGKRKGFGDTRGTLFFEIARIISAKRPRLLLLENVKGLLSHDNGRTFATIIRTLDELGYDCQWQVLNSKNFGVPQNRERVFIVGHLRGTPRPKVFPFGENDSKHSTLGQRETQITGTLNVSMSKGGNKQDANSRVLVSEIGTYRTHKDGQGFRPMKSGIAPTIPARAREDGSGQPVIRIREATKKGYAEANLDTGMQQHTLDRQGAIRRLTPVECERLQGFPDNWTEGVSDTQRYKCLGNAVTVNVIEFIIGKLG